MNDSATRGINPDEFKHLAPIPQKGARRATKMMHTGRLFRYEGAGSEDSEAASSSAILQLASTCAMRLSALREDTRLAYIVEIMRAALNHVDRSSRAAASP